MVNKYNFKYRPDNVYGHVVELLKGYDFGEGVHLDIGCGYGPIAEYVSSELGLTYIGIDKDQDGLNDLKARGFEAYQYEFGDVEKDKKFIRSVLGKRKIKSMSVIDVFEHLIDPSSLMRFLHSLAQKNNILIVTSVPNIGHIDVALKLMSGQFDITDTGLLDRNHRNMFTERSFLKLMHENNWLQVAKRDVTYDKSDQHFPLDHFMMSDKASLPEFLKRVRSSCDDNSLVFQFVRSFLPGPLISDKPLKVEKPEPFLTIIMRTQGKRPGTLKEAFLCLQAQSCRDFEVIVIGHKLSAEAAELTEEMIECNPKWLKNKTTFRRLGTGNRTHPLNLGLSLASGRYFAILDDDDLVFSNWVETFQSMAKKTPGRVLHTSYVTQTCDELHTQFSKITAMASGPMNDLCNRNIDILTQLVDNWIPSVAAAVPRSIYRDMGVSFDESINTSEDWDIFMRAILLCGFNRNEEVTSIYRKWTNSETSFTVHSRRRWNMDHNRILRKLDENYLLLPPGYASKIRHLIVERNDYYERAVKKSEVPQSNNLGREKRQHLFRLLMSRKWRNGRLIRVVNRLIIGEKIVVPDVFDASDDEIEQAIVKIEKFLNRKLFRKLYDK